MAREKLYNLMAHKILFTTLMVSKLKQRSKKLPDKGEWVWQNWLKDLQSQQKRNLLSAIQNLLEFF